MQAAAAKPEQAPEQGQSLKQIAARRDAAWRKADRWQALYDDAYRFALPNRRPARVGQGQRSGGQNGEEKAIEIFDATASEMVFQSAAQLRDDIAPPGAQIGRLGLTRLARRKLEVARGLEAVRTMETIHAEISDAANITFSGSSGFPTALLEVCLDAHIGTGALLALKGDIYQPVLWAAIPQDEIALEIDLFGRDRLISWRQQATKSQIRGAFPRGKFPADFLRDWEKSSEDEIEFEQVWLANASGIGWRYLVFLRMGHADSSPIVDALSTSCPVIPMHYNRVPGEERGRGPILNVMPAIRTANRVMEYQLKAAAIDLLGIWLYNPNELNPDTLSLEPGAFWPGYTGGFMGESVKRLDTRGDRSDIAANLMQDLRAQIQGGFQRTPLPETGKTPGSATEYMVRDKENLRKYRGAYGRMVEDFVPRVFWRVVEIVQELGLVEHRFPIDKMITQLDVLSPLAVAMRLNTYQPVIEYMQVAGAIMALPPQVDLFVDRIRLLNDMSYDAGIRPEHQVDEEERAEKLQAEAAGQVAAMAAEAAKGAPPPPEPLPPGTPA